MKKVTSKAKPDQVNSNNSNNSSNTSSKIALPLNCSHKMISPLSNRRNRKIQFLRERDLLGRQKSIRGLAGNKVSYKNKVT